MNYDTYKEELFLIAFEFEALHATQAQLEGQTMKSFGYYPFLHKQHAEALFEVVRENAKPDCVVKFAAVFNARSAPCREERESDQAFVDKKLEELTIEFQACKYRHDTLSLRAREALEESWDDLKSEKRKGVEWDRFSLALLAIIKAAARSADGKLYEFVAEMIAKFDPRKRAWMFDVLDEAILGGNPDIVKKVMEHAKDWEIAHKFKNFIHRTTVEVNAVLFSGLSLESKTEVRNEIMSGYENSIDGAFVSHRYKQLLEMVELLKAKAILKRSLERKFSKIAL